MIDPVIRSSFLDLLDRTIRETYIPALQEQLNHNILGDLIGNTVRGNTPEDVAAWEAWEARWARMQAEQAEEDAACALHVEKIKAIFADLPERVQNRLLDDLDDDRYED